MAKTPDLFDATVATYQNPEGAQGYMAKEKPHHDHRTKRAFTVVDDLDVRGWKVLDVGCGFGRDVGEFRARGAEAYGFDVSAALLGEARRNFGDYFAEGNVREKGALPFGGAFDLIWCCAVLVHVPRVEVEPFLRRLWEGLKLGGRLVIWTKIGEGEKVMSNLGEGLPRMMVYYQLEELSGPLRSWGAEVELSGDNTRDVLPTGDSLTFLRVRKPL